MTGLRSYARDLGLPARLGEARIAPPSAEQAVGLFGRILFDEATHGRVTGAELETARWKPRVSCAASYRVRFEDGSQELCALKHYADGKARNLIPCERKGEFAVLPARSLVLWRARADRELTGIARAFDRRRLARWVEEGGCVPPRSVRRRRTGLRFLRYKPERRAIVRVDLSLRGGEPGQLRLAARFHPPGRAARIARARCLLEERAPEAHPRLALHVPHAGLLLEPWLELEEQGATDFALTPVAGQLLGRLHALELPSSLEARQVPDPAGDRELFAVDEGLRASFDAWYAARPRPGAGEITWTHGDVHPDQLARETRSGEFLLLDLDELAPGDPSLDLGSWIADWLWEEPDLAYADAEQVLLEAYQAAGAGAPPCDRNRLRAATADALVARAAAGIRRLQEGAIERARTAFDRIEAELYEGMRR